MNNYFIPLVKKFYHIDNMAFQVSNDSIIIMVPSPYLTSALNVVYSENSFDNEKNEIYLKGFLLENVRSSPDNAFGFLQFRNPSSNNQ